MSKGYPYSPAKKPDNIHKYIETPRSPGMDTGVTAKRPDRNSGHFEGLDTKGNSDYGYHQCKTSDKIFDCNNDAS